MSYMLLIFIQNVEESIPVKSHFDSSRYLNSFSSYTNSTWGLIFFPGNVYHLVPDIARTFPRIASVICLGAFGSEFHVTEKEMAND